MVEHVEYHNSKGTIRSTRLQYLLEIKEDKLTFSCPIAFAIQTCFLKITSYESPSICVWHKLRQEMANRLHFISFKHNLKELLVNRNVQSLICELQTKTPVQQCHFCYSFIVLYIINAGNSEE